MLKRELCLVTAGFIILALLISRFSLWSLKGGQILDFVNAFKTAGHKIKIQNCESVECTTVNTKLDSKIVLQTQEAGLVPSVCVDLTLLSAKMMLVWPFWICKFSTQRMIKLNKGAVKLDAAALRGSLPYQCVLGDRSIWIVVAGKCWQRQCFEIRTWYFTWYRIGFIFLVLEHWSVRYERKRIYTVMHFMQFRSTTALYCFKSSSSCEFSTWNYV